jgi:4-aminobutyrate aminotransferase-like enzyme
MLGVKASDNVIRLLPPLIVTKKEIDEAITIIEKTIKEF